MGNAFSECRAIKNPDRARVLMALFLPLLTFGVHFSETSIFARKVHFAPMIGEHGGPPPVSEVEAKAKKPEPK